MNDGSEAEIARGLRAGEAAAWQRLYDAYAERVWRGVARLIGPHPADVADVVQEAMIAAARSARNFDATKGSLWQWLWGIARTQVQLHYRKKQHHDRWKHEPPERWGGSDPPPVDQLEAAEQAAAVRRTLAELPGDYDTLLTAKYLDGDSVETIAGRERLTVAAVTSKLARARDAFKRAFEKLKEKVP